MKAVKVIFAVILGIILLVTLVGFGLMHTVNSTVFNADFMAKQIQNLDMSDLAGEIIGEQIIQSLPPEAAFAGDAIGEVLVEIEPWIDQQADVLIHRIYGYMLGETDSYAVTVPLAELKTILLAKIEVIVPDAIPGFASLPPAQQAQLLEQMKQEFTGSFPADLVIDESLLGAEFTATIEQAREYLSYSRMGYWGMIGLIAVLSLIIILIFRTVRGAARTLGIVALLFGLLELGLYFGAQTFALPLLPVSELPASMGGWALGLVEAVIGTVLVTGISSAVVGLGLIILSALYRREAA